jgi:Tfp pilus assembly protein PilX
MGDGLMNPKKPNAFPTRGQRGVVLLLALIMLVAMTLAGIMLYRQIGTGLIIARNLNFKRTAAVASDRGIETARTWLIGRTAAQLEQGSAADGYFPGWCNTVLDAGGQPDADNDGQADDCGNNPPPSEFDPMVFNWATSALATANDGVGHEVRYVIHRLCETPGAMNASGQQCVTIGSASAGSARTSAVYGSQALSNTSQPYFRITARTLGPTNTVVYTQTILY